MWLVRNGQRETCARAPKHAMEMLFVRTGTHTRPLAAGRIGQARGCQGHVTCLPPLTKQTRENPNDA